MSRCISPISRARRSAGLIWSTAGSLTFSVWMVCGSCTRFSGAAAGSAGFGSCVSVAVSAGVSGTTSSSMFERWNGSMPRARNWRTASKSEVAASPFFWATRRAMRNCRPVSPSRRMSSRLGTGSLATVGRVGTVAAWDGACGRGVASPAPAGLHLVPVGRRPVQAARSVGVCGTS